MWAPSTTNFHEWGNEVGIKEFCSSFQLLKYTRAGENTVVRKRYKDLESEGYQKISTELGLKNVVFTKFNLGQHDVPLQEQEINSLEFINKT